MRSVSLISFGAIIHSYILWSFSGEQQNKKRSHKTDTKGPFRLSSDRYLSGVYNRRRPVWVMSPCYWFRLRRFWQLDNVALSKITGHHRPYLLLYKESRLVKWHLFSLGWPYIRPALPAAWYEAIIRPNRSSDFESLMPRKGQLFHSLKNSKLPTE